MFLRFFFEAGLYSHIDASHCHTATCNPPLYSSTGGLPADFIHPPVVRGCQRVSPKISPASGLRKRAGEFALLSDPFRRFDVTGQLTQGARQTLAVCFRFSPYFDCLSSARFATAGLAPAEASLETRRCAKPMPHLLRRFCGPPPAARIIGGEAGRWMPSFLVSKHRSTGTSPDGDEVKQSS